jgi:hypothetical protein
MYYCNKAVGIVREVGKRWISDFKLKNKMREVEKRGIWLLISFSGFFSGFKIKKK